MKIFHPLKNSWCIPEMLTIFQITPTRLKKNTNSIGTLNHILHDKQRAPCMGHKSFVDVMVAFYGFGRRNVTDFMNVLHGCLHFLGGPFMKFCIYLRK